MFLRQPGGFSGGLCLGRRRGGEGKKKKATKTVAGGVGDGRGGGWEGPRSQ